MSLYRTWRPKSFADLVGQDAVVRTLTSAIDTGRLAHAYLFSGPRGSGKTSAAKILARCIECVHGPTATPDNTCENCRAILAGTALDVLEIDAASNRGIDEIRALREAVKFAPATMRMKVYIIDEAHMLTKEGANAFLKTLEEPPPYAVFILATTAPEALPPTILSRCQRYAFRRIPIETMIDRMRTISIAEGIAIDDAALGAIAYRADGGLRDALTMLEQVAAYADGSVDAATVDAAFGQTGRAFARRLLAASLDGNATAALIAIDEASDAGTDMAGLIRSTIGEFRHLLVARINPELLARDLSGDDAAAALERARVTPQSRLIRGLRLLADALAAARGSGNARLELETATLRFILQQEDPSLDALAARVAVLEGAAGEPAAVLPSPPPAATPPVSASAEAPRPRSRSVASSPPAATPAPQSHAADHAGSSSGIAPVGDLSLHKIRSLWQNVSTRVAGTKVTLRAPLSQTTVHALDGDVLTLRVADRTSAELLKANMATLRAALDGLLGRPLEVRISVEGGRTGSPPAEPDERDTDLMRYAIDRLP
ncbi:MAG: DNA polymerase III subunit gamma/tau [Candidatus Velthaea sp.]|jgi:DNA polymerase-3 subunit gamma/tau